MATASLRERQKQRRRAQILEAARTLLRERAADAIGVDQVAELAEVSVATVYNLVGNRAQLWAAPTLAGPAAPPRRCRWAR